MKSYLTISSAIFTLAIATTSCGGPSEESAEDKETNSTPNVETGTSVAVPEFSHWVSFQANVEARRNVVLNAEMGGVIRSVMVEEGQFVKAGKVLVVMDSDVMSQSIYEVESALELAEYMRDKQKKLFEQNLGTELDLKQAEGQVEQLERKRSTLRVQAGKSVLIAPFDGYVEDIGGYVGEMAAPQIPLVRFINLDKITITAEISEAYLNKIRAGSRAKIIFPTLKLEFDSVTITRAGKLINPANRTFKVEIDMDNPNGLIVPNLLAELYIMDESVNNAVVVPSQSVLEDKNGRKYLYIVTAENIVRRKYIQAGLSYNGMISVKEGLKAGETIVTVGADGLIDSMKVDVVKF
jgi:RND family efflux transporter MFP subunit